VAEEVMATARKVGRACSLDGSVSKPVPAASAMDGVETVEVTVRAFLQAVRFEKHGKAKDGKDNDFHVEISGTSKWKSPHVIVEVPPGTEYCKARQKVVDLIKADKV
jgi:hypothetical protein